MCFPVLSFSQHLNTYQLLRGPARNTFIDRHIKGVRMKEILKYVLSKWFVIYLIENIG